MTPDAALEAQIERYRKMTGEQRLEIGFRLHELSCNVAREGIRAQFPGITEAEVERRLRERIRLVYTAKALGMNYALLNVLFEGMMERQFK